MLRLRILSFLFCLEWFLRVRLWQGYISFVMLSVKDVDRVKVFLRFFVFSGYLFSFKSALLCYDTGVSYSIYLV